MSTRPYVMSPGVLIRGGAELNEIDWAHPFALAKTAFGILLRADSG